jgi:hypothetical protein
MYLTAGQATSFEDDDRQGSSLYGYATRAQRRRLPPPAVRRRQVSLNTQGWKSGVMSVCLLSHFEQLRASRLAL